MAKKEIKTIKSLTKKIKLEKQKKLSSIDNIVPVPPLNFNELSNLKKYPTTSLTMTPTPANNDRSVPIKSLTVKLFPHDNICKSLMEEESFNPYLEITLHSDKKIKDIIRHLKKKWTLKASHLEIYIMHYTTEEILKDQISVFNLINPATKVLKLQYNWKSTTPEYKKKRRIRPTLLTKDLSPESILQYIPFIQSIEAFGMKRDKSNVFDAMPSPQIQYTNNQTSFNSVSNFSIFQNEDLLSISPTMQQSSTLLQEQTWSNCYKADLFVSNYSRSKEYGFSYQSDPTLDFSFHDTMSRISCSELSAFTEL